MFREAATNATAQLRALHPKLAALMQPAAALEPVALNRATVDWGSNPYLRVVAGLAATQLAAADGAKMTARLQAMIAAAGGLPSVPFAVPASHTPVGVDVSARGAA